MNKIIGYIISAVGLIGLAVYILPQIKEKLTFLESVDDIIILVASIIVIAIGVLFVVKNKRGGPKGVEVPIYSGENVVGYRRH